MEAGAANRERRVETRRLTELPPEAAPMDMTVPKSISTAMSRATRARDFLWEEFLRSFIKIFFL
jgi:hypothetical protein